MREWAPRSGALLLSLILHSMALLLLQVRRLPHLALPESAPLPVKIIQRPAPPPPKRPAAVAAVPKPVAPPPAPPPEAKAEAEKPPEPPPEKKIPLPEQQIVEPPEADKEAPPPDTRLLSDRDNVVEKQTVKHGEPAQGEDGRQPKAAAENPGERKARRDVPERGRQTASLPRLEQLLPSAVQIAREGYGQAEPEAQAAERESSPKTDRLRSGQVWLPRSEVTGTLDFLPDVQPGDITLLNTKAERFAPFVRRVALRVFQNLLISLRRQITTVGHSTEEAVTMEAIMSRGGELMTTEVTKRSSRVALASDRLLQQACLDGFFDRNPPPGAESPDGNIHFLLRTHVVSIVDSSGQRFGYRISFEAGLL